MRWRLLLSLGIVAVTAWLLGTFWAETSQQATLDSYPVDFHSARWIEPPDTGPRSYFRYSFNVDNPPTSAILWIDAEQFYSASINNSIVANDISNYHSGARALGTAVDVTRRIVVGTNALTVQVTNRDGSVAAMVARLTVVSGGQATDYVTGPSWRATSDTDLVKPRLDLGLPLYTDAKFDDSQWGVAQVTGAVLSATLAAMPTDVMDGPLAGSVLSAPHFARELVAAAVIDVPGTPNDAWVRIAASGPYAVFLDGQLMTTRPEPIAPLGQVSRARPIVLTLVNLSSYVHTGANVLAIHVAANPLAAVYVDGRVNTSEGSIPVATGGSWRVTGPPLGNALHELPSTQGSDLGLAAGVWPQGVIRTVASTTALGLPTGPSPAARVLSVGGLIAAWLLMGWAAARAAGVPLERGLVADAVGHLPAGFGIAAVEQMSRLANVVPPFPHTLLALWLLVGVLAVGKLSADAALAWPRLEAAQRVPDLAWRRPRLDATLIEAASGGLEWLRGRWNAVVIGGIAAVCGAAAAFALNYQPVWQDELASLDAAQGIRHHLIPKLPSTLLYWKGELYSALLAVVGAATSDNVVSLRAISVFWYIATILAFAFLLLPMVIPGRRKLQVIVTLIFAIAPAELLWSRDMRMYQMAQFFFVIFLALFFRAMQKPRTRMIAAAAAALVLMYLSHEETFVFLPAVPIVFLALMRGRWVRDWRWWVFGLGAFGIIGIQYALANFSHPPYFGFDTSNKPLVAYDPSNSYYYFDYVYFAPFTNGGSLAIVSTLALIGGIIGAVRRSVPRVYLSAFLWIAVVSLSVIFTPKIPRYTFVTLPLLFALAGPGAADIVDGARRLLTGLAEHERRMVHALVTVSLVPAILWLVLTQASSTRDFGLAAARITGAPMVQAHTDYAIVADYVRAHQRAGDELVTLAPPNIIGFYVGRRPDGIIATSRNKLLYLMEIRGKAVDTTYGAQAILTVEDLQQVMQAHHRIWIVTDQGTYFNSVDPQITKLIQSQFDLVAEGAASAVYFRDA